MASKPRRDIVNPAEVATYYCQQRCAAQAFRLNSPDGSKERMNWIRQAQVQLAGLFGIEVDAHRIQGNEFCSMLTTRPDIVTLWSDEDVVRRWLRIASMKRNGALSTECPPERRVLKELEEPDRVLRLRKRLSDISWFMGAVAECVSRRINAADNTSGTVWEGAFRCSKLEGTADELMCMACIDLGFGEAVVQDVVETYEFSSIRDRIDGALESQATVLESVVAQEGIAEEASTHAACSVATHAADEWLKPFTKIAGAHRTGRSTRGGQPSSAEYPPRASDDGLFESITLPQYRDLLSWLKKRLLGATGDSVPDDLNQCLESLRVTPGELVDFVFSPPRRLVGLRLSREIRARNVAYGLCA